jgi:hypothetical protein
MLKFIEKIEILLENKRFGEEKVDNSQSIMLKVNKKVNKKL